MRVVAGGGPPLRGATMSEKRQHFIRDYDWIRTGLMFEPRGHDVMSGSILYEPMRDDTDAALLFIETSGCLPMCGHGTIGTVTVLLEEGLVTPKRRRQAPAWRCRPASSMPNYARDNHGNVIEVRIRNVPSFLYQTGLVGRRAGLRTSVFDVAYGGNFYAIIEPQEDYRDLDDISAFDIQKLSPIIRQLINEKYTFIHPDESDDHRPPPRPVGGHGAQSRGRTRATPSSTARRRSTARPAAPAPRRAWRRRRRAAN